VRPPPGRQETAALVAAGRFDLLRAVLRGLNPEGRAWAAHALLEHQKAGTKLDPADAAAIEKLRALPLKTHLQLRLRSLHGALRRGTEEGRRVGLTIGSLPPKEAPPMLFVLYALSLVSWSAS
jgi:hypothetical protein